MINRKLKRALAPYVLIAPACVLLLVFLYGVANGIVQGFGIMPFLGMTTPTLDYYAQALSHPELIASIKYSLYLAAVSSALAVVGGVVLSAALTQAKASRLFQLLGVQVPISTAHMLVAIAAVCLFAGSGLVPRILAALGFTTLAESFPTVVGAASGWGIIFVYLWKEIPFVAFCTVTIMANISEKFGEAAAGLGASPARTFFGITLPLCKGAIVKAFLIVFAFAFGSYEIPFLLGPTLPKALPVLAYIEFQDPDLMNRCYAMALNGIMALICTVLAAAYFAVLQRERKGGRS